MCLGIGTMVPGYYGKSQTPPRVATRHARVECVGTKELVAFGFQKPLHFDGGHASGARRSDRLAIRPVLDVAGVKNARDVGARAAVRDDVAVGIEIDLAGERRGVG